MLKIAELLNVEPQPLDGEAPELTPARMVAVIDEITVLAALNVFRRVR